MDRDAVEFTEVWRARAELAQVAVREDRPRTEVEPALVEGLAVPAMGDVASVVDVLRQASVIYRLLDLHLPEDVDSMHANLGADPLANGSRPVDFCLIAAAVRIPADAQGIDRSKYFLGYPVEQSSIGADLDLASDSTGAYGPDMLEKPLVQQRLTTDEPESIDSQDLRQRFQITHEG